MYPMRMKEHAYLFVVIADPERDGCAPIPISRNIPVPRIGKPISETTITDVLRNPKIIQELIEDHITIEE